MKHTLGPMSPVHSRLHRRQSASAVVVVLGLLAILFFYIAANIRTVHYLGRELRLIEQQQIRRLK
jgi:hypothetical protein